MRDVFFALSETAIYLLEEVECNICSRGGWSQSMMSKIVASSLVIVPTLLRAGRRPGSSS